ncbi:MAG: S8 family serine peptidase [Sphingobacteriaceae bacterium]|nr:S8 family serine peptidase [Sphingobacteriaceae bacterium]
MNKVYLDSLVSKGATIRHTSKWLNGASIEVPDTNVLAAIQALPFVRNSRKTGRISNPAVPIADDKFMVLNQSASASARIARLTNANYGASYNQIRLHNGDVLHNLGYMGQGMRIAVFDAGFINVNVLACFDSLFLQNRIVDTYDFVDLQTGVYGFDSHGTYVLGCMAGVIPGALIGTAPKAEYLLYRTENNVGGSENQIEEDNWVAAAERADSAGADVFNTSLSYTTFDDPGMNYTYADMNGNTARITKASDLAAKKGILVVASAGNYGNGGWTYIGAPADGDSVLSIGAVNAEGNRVGFSSLGPTADGRLKPNVMAQGSAAVSCQLSGQGTTLVSGTSFSGPIMAGLAACLWQAFPNLSNMDIYRGLERSGNNHLTPNNQIGHGLPDLQYALTILGSADLKTRANNLRVHPNPFENHLHITFDHAIAGDTFLYFRDIQGRLVTSENLGFVSHGPHAFRFETPPNLLPGIYVIELSNSYHTHIAKVVKQ